MILRSQVAPPPKPAETARKKFRSESGSNLLCMVNIPLLDVKQLPARLGDRRYTMPHWNLISII